MCSLQRNYDVIRNWARFETGPLTVSFYIIDGHIQHAFHLLQIVLLM